MKGREAYLLGLAGLFILLNQLALIVGSARQWETLGLVGLWALLAGGGWWLLNRLLPQHDPYLFPTTMLLAGWGLNLINRLLPIYTLRQSLWVGVGLLAMLAICRLPGHLRWLERYRYTWLMMGLLLLAATILLGVNPSGGGPRLWLGAEGLFYQPSELLKVLLVVFVASYLAEHYVSPASEGPRRLPAPQYLGPMVLMWGVTLVVLVWQRDLGAATIFFAVFVLMLYVASGATWVLLGGALLLGLAALGAYFVFDVVALRFDIWLNPWRDADNTAFQIVQSLIAVATGGLLGTGVGQGNPGFIPVVHTDFAYAAIAEEWGLLGSLAVIAALLILIMRGLRVALLLQARPFHVFLAVGLVALLAVQSLLIIGGTLNLLPLTGVTLPFVSYGGSSLLTSFVMVGLLLRLSAEVETL